MSSPARDRPWTRLAVVFGIWMGLAVFLAGQAYLVVYTTIQAHADLPHQRPALALTELFLSSVAECVIWAFMTLGILWLAKRFPFGQGRWLRSLAVHVAACLVCGVVAVALSVLAAEVIRKEFVRPTVTFNVLMLFFVAKLNNNIFFYAAILAVAHVLGYYRQWRERELIASQLEAKLAQTQLQVLKMQLHPHFLFNTLNAISALIHQDVELADRMIAQLGDLLRTTLERANQQEVALKQEIDFIRPYLDIEKARLGSRLTVDLQIDPAVMDAKVPNLLLQPLVENAIRHGIAPYPKPGTLSIAAGRDNGVLRLAVSDSGPGLQAAPESPEALHGIGLANTRARLEKLYGAQQRLDLRQGPDGGLRVEITIPFREIAMTTDSANAEAGG
jgi:two-component system LytT family sensor kinase